MIRRVMTALVAVAVSACLPTAASAAEPIEQAAGTVVRNDPLPSDLWLSGTGSAQRLTYWTRTSDDQPALSTGAVFIPSGPAPAGGWPVVSWAHGTVGMGDECAPSSAGRKQRDMTYLAHWLSQGYAVVATDYIGLGTPGPHTYLDGRAEAHAAIDMVRAARATADSLAAKWVAIGHSQGGSAALFTASMATRYAPELDYRGGVATGPATNVVETAALLSQPQMPSIPNPSTTVDGAYLLAGLKAARPEFDLDSYLSPIGRDLTSAAQTLCLGQLSQRAEGITVGQLVSRPLSEGNFLAIARSVMDVPVVGYDRPLFIAQGLLDRDVPTPLTAKLIADLRTHGVTPEVHIYPDKDHGATVLASIPDSVRFITRVFG